MVCRLIHAERARDRVRRVAAGGVAAVAGRRGSEMLRPDRDVERVYLHRAPVDMRKQMDGLSILAKDVIQQDPMSGSMFVFINARRNKLKILVWERNGFIVWYKRLEQQRFHWPRGAGECGPHAHRRAVALAARWLRCVAHEAARSAAFLGVFVSLAAFACGIICTREHAARQRRPDTISRA